MDLKDYKSSLQSMDWWFDYSDDHRVYRAGLYRKQFLEALSILSPDHKAAWDEVQQQLRDHRIKELEAEVERLQGKNEYKLYWL